MLEPVHYMELQPATKGVFTYKILYRYENRTSRDHVVPVEQPGWTHTGKIWTGMTFRTGVMSQ